MRPAQGRLLAELAGRAEARGHIVLSGSASEQEHDLPFSVFIHALDEFLASLEPDERLRAPADRIASLGRAAATKTGELAVVLPWRGNLTTALVSSPGRCASIASSRLSMSLANRKRAGP